MNSIIPPKGSIPPGIRNHDNLDDRINQGYARHYVSNYSPRIIKQDKNKATENLRLYLRDELQRRLSLLEEDIRLCEQEGLNAENLNLEAGLIREQLQYTW